MWLTEEEQKKKLVEKEFQNKHLRIENLCGAKE